MKPIAHDPIEDDPTLRPLIEAAKAEAEEIVERRWEENGYTARGLRMGKVPAIWKETARILRERHGIEWKNPMKMTPGLRVD